MEVHGGVVRSDPPDGRVPLRQDLGLIISSSAVPTERVPGGLLGPQVLDRAELGGDLLAVLVAADGRVQSRAAAYLSEVNLPGKALPARTELAGDGTPSR